MASNKWLPTLGEASIGIGSTVALVASGWGAVVPAVWVLGGAAWAARRSDRIQAAAHENALLAPIALPGDEGAAPRQLPPPGGLPAAAPKRKKDGPGWLRGLLESVLTEDELAELNAVEERRAPVHQTGLVGSRAFTQVKAAPSRQDGLEGADDGLEDDGDYAVEEERPVLSMRDAMRALPKLVLLGSLQPYPDSPLAVPMGVNQYGEAVWGDFGDDLLHVGVYGTSGSGKDQVLRTWFALLAKRNQPSEVQFVFLDGKGDWLTPDLAELRCMWRAPAGGYGKEGREAILEALKAVDSEARDRSKLIREAGCRSIEQFNQRHPDAARPLLFVVASDIGDIGGESEEIFTSLTQKARSLGFRIIASMQSPTGKKMDWRLNLSSLLAGAMVDSSQDGPALGIRETSNLPYRPSAIPQPPKVRGVFVVRFRGEVMLVRTPMFRADKYENEDRFDRIVASLPAKKAHKPSERATRRFEAILPGETREEYEQRIAMGARGVVEGAGRPVVNGYAYTADDEALLARLMGGSVNNKRAEVHTVAHSGSAGSASALSSATSRRQDAVEVQNGSAVRAAKTVVSEYQALDAEVRKLLPKALHFYDENGGQITPAIREAFGVDGGRSFKPLADALRLALELREVAKTAKR